QPKPEHRLWTKPSRSCGTVGGATHLCVMEALHELVQSRGATCHQQCPYKRGDEPGELKCPLRGQIITRSCAHQNQHIHFQLGQSEVIRQLLSKCSHRAQSIDNVESDHMILEFNILVT